MSAEDDIAIVGMAGLFPQSDDIDIFWQNILARRDCVTDSPAGWLGDGAIYDPATDDPLKLYTRRGGFLGDLSRFEARQFGTMPLSISGGQPDQFLALKLAHDALEDAGLTPGRFDGTATGVILGHSVHAHRGNTNGIHQAWFDNQIRNLIRTLVPEVDPARLEEAIRLMDGGLPRLAPEAIPGLVPNVLTGRVANRLDLMGPNYIIDAACSSSLIAVDLAIGELRAGRADMMLAGGINTTTSPLVYSVFCAVDALSREGRIRPFDKGASGTVLGEGGGIVVLKRLRDAIRDDDRIHAVIKGVGQSSDGKSSGLMAPRLEGEVLAVRRAYAQTGIDPATIGLIEAHGTGIPLGDRTEVEALRQVFGGRQGHLPRVPLGSLKSMIGHCIPAAGSASIIKMARALTERILPPMLCDEVHDGIGLEDTPFTIPTEALPWVHTGTLPRRAAVNAFGFGGINAHMILEESPVGRQQDPTAAFLPPSRAALAVAGGEAGREEVFAFAAPDRAALVEALDAFNARAEGRSLEARASETWDIAQGHPGPARLAIVAADTAELDKKIGSFRAKLARLPAGEGMQTRNGIHYEDRPLEGRIAFLFPGEMGQYPDMMKEAALAFPVVRDWLDFISDLTADRREVALHQVIFPARTVVSPEGRAMVDELMHRVDYGSEMVFAADQAVFALLGAMGVKPDAMLGHSTGENAALVASGRIGLDRARVGRMIAQMNRIFAQVEASGAVPKGLLLNVAALERPALLALLERFPGLRFTMDNCPNQAIVFGQEAEIAALQQAAVAQGAVCTLLPISWGYHTEHVAPMAEAFGQLFEGMKLSKSPVTLYSCAAAAPFPGTRDAFQRMAVSQYTSRVRFTEAVERLYADGCRIFVECGPNATLTAFVRDTLGNRPHLAVSADNRRRGMVSQLRHLAAQLFTAGVEMDPRPVLSPPETPDEARRRATRERQAKAPALASNLPFITLDAAGEARLRTLVLGEGRASAAQAPAPASAAPLPAASAAPVGTPAGAAAPAAPSRSGAVSGHLSLMGDFLRGQGRVTGSALGAPMAPATPAPRQRIEVLDLSSHFALPFAFRAFLMRGTPGVAALVPWLSPAEMPEAEAMSTRRGWTDWALGRLAAKQAAMAMGAASAPAALSIVKDAAGAPHLAGPGGPLPAISIAHAGGTGLAIAAEAGARVGIDYDLPGRIRDPRSFMEQILSPDEARALALPEDAGHAVAVWCLKEAAAKALGMGLQGHPQAFVLLSYDAGSGRAELAHDGQRILAELRQLGAGLCALAHVAIPAAAPHPLAVPAE